MPRPRFVKWSALAVKACIVLLVSGCTPSPSSSSGGTSTLTDVIASKTLRVCTLTDDPPFASISSSGNLEGYDIDLSHLIGKTLGANVVFVKTDFAGRVPSLQTGKCDVIIGDITATLARAQVVAFTDPYVLLGVGMVSLAKDNFQSFSDLNKPNIKIGGERGTAETALLPTVFPKAQIVLFTGSGDVVAALQAGQIQAGSLNDPLIGILLKDHPGQFQKVGTDYILDEDNFGSRLGDFSWWLWLNTFTRRINTDGTSLGLWNKWLGGPAPSFMTGIPGTSPELSSPSG
jgi:polar amino acid transport system substrate-binding protein